MVQDFEIVITAPADRSRQADIWMDNQVFAELGVGEGNQLVLEVSPRVDNAPWRIDLDRLTRTIEAAKEKLGQPSPFRVDRQ